MKKLTVLLLLVSAGAFAKDVHHDGYMRSNGTYVQPHYQTAPDNTLLNNYSTKGNYNPYTGRAGTVNPYPAQIQQPIISPPNIYQPAQPRSRY